MSKQINSDGPAFPTNAGGNLGDHEGMTLRDYFAAKAMQGMLADGNSWVTTDITETAYRVADAMLEARQS